MLIFSAFALYGYSKFLMTNMIEVFDFTFGQKMIEIVRLDGKILDLFYLQNPVL